MNKRFDVLLFLTLLLLSVFSVFNILGINSNLVTNQVVYLILGFIVYFIFNTVGIQFFKFNSKTFYIFAFILLVITYLIGIESRGSKRWIDFHFFRFQSSEFLKLFFILYLAEFFSRFDKTTLSFLKQLALFLPPIFLIFKQPDLGNAIIYFVIYLGILFFYGFPVKHFIMGAVVTILSTPIIWKILNGYQKQRIVSFINPDATVSTTSYNLIQSIITVGSGEFFGRGLGMGTQSRNLFLPENHTDFAYASLVEQFGFVGGILVILLYLLLIYLFAKKALSHQKDKFTFLFLIGATTYLFAQVVINIGMNVGLFPVAGIALPLITYGGSSILTTMMILGLASGL